MFVATSIILVLGIAADVFRLMPKSSSPSSVPDNSYNWTQPHCSARLYTVTPFQCSLGTSDEGLPIAFDMQVPSRVSSVLESVDQNFDCVLHYI